MPPKYYTTKTKEMQYRELGHTGMMISHLSFGASSLGSVFHETNEKDSFEAV